ncbi:MAG: hypothetical protein JRD71_04195 [Deltaproteobacteria bacterium]|nr:hypothetical protein [Deltaproteobacteria bacterium]
MCCLKFEYETYLALKKKFPKIDKTVKTSAGKGKVVRHNVISSQKTIRKEDGQEIETTFDKPENERNL